MNVNIKNIQKKIISLKLKNDEIIQVQRNCEKHEEQLEIFERERDLIVNSIGKEEYEKVTESKFTEYDSVYTNDDEFCLDENIQEIQNQLQYILEKYERVKDFQKEEKQLKSDIDNIKKELKVVKDKVGLEIYKQKISEEKKKKQPKRNFSYLSESDKKRKMRRANEGDTIVDHRYYNQQGITYYRVKKYKELEYIGDYETILDEL